MPQIEDKDKLPTVLKTPPMLVINAKRPIGVVSFQVLGDNDKTVFTVNVPATKTLHDLTYFAPLHNLLMSSTLKRLFDEKVLILQNKAEIDEWTKEKCPGTGTGGECPVPELKDQKPLTFDDITADATEITGKGEPDATVSVTVGADSYYAVITAGGTFSIAAQNLVAGEFNATSIKTGYKAASGKLKVAALLPASNLTVNAFDIKGVLTGTAGPSSKVVVSSALDKVETVADAQGAFSVSTASLYLSDTDYEITVTANELGHDPATIKSRGQKLPVPNVTATPAPVFGDNSVIVKTDPHARMKLGTVLATADADGNAVFVTLVKEELSFEFGFDATSIYESAARVIAPEKREVFLNSGDAKPDATEHTVRVVGTIAGIPAILMADIDGTAKTFTSDAQGVAKLTGIDLTTVTSFTVEIISSEYKADTITVAVKEDGVELLDQRAITLSPVVEDELTINGSAEKGAIVEFIIGSNVFYTKSDDQHLFTLNLPEGQAPGTYTVNSYKSGYKDATKQFDIRETQPSEPIVINEYYARTTMTGTAQGSALITVSNSTGSVETTASVSGDWSVDTSPLFPRDTNEELTVKSVRKKYKNVVEKITALRIPAPAITLVDTLYYGDKAVAIATDPKVRVLFNTSELETSLDGKAVYIFADPLATDVKFTIGSAADSIYVKTDKSFTPTKWETYLIATQTKQTDTTLSVHVLSLTTGLPLPDAELSFNGDKFTATADVNGIITFTGLDLTTRTEAVVKLVSDVYVAAPVTVKILTELSSLT